MMNFYVICASAGFTFLAGSLLLGHVLDAGDDAHEHSPEGLPILGPSSLAALLCGFGCGGYVGVKLGLPELMSLVPAGGVGAVMWIGSAAITRVLTKLGSGGRSVRASGYVGEQARVTVGIPAGGVGEITFVSQGEVVNVSARSAGGAAVPQDSVVTIEEMQDGVAVVGPAVDDVLKLEASRRAGALNAAAKQKQGG